MSDNNIVDFPATSANPTAQPVPEEALQEKAEQSANFMMQLIEKNRKKGLETLKGKVESLATIEQQDNPSSEDRFRDVSRALGGTLETLEALNSLVEYIKHDLIACIRSVQEQGVAGWQYSAHLQTLIETLKKKELVSEEELKEMWNSTIPSQVKKNEEPQEKAEEETTEE